MSVCLFKGAVSILNDTLEMYFALRCYARTVLSVLVGVVSPALHLAISYSQDDVLK